MENTKDEIRLKELQEEQKLLKNIINIQKETIDKLIDKFILDKKIGEEA